MNKTIKNFYRACEKLVKACPPELYGWCDSSQHHKIPIDPLGHRYEVYIDNLDRTYWEVRIDNKHASVSDNVVSLDITKPSTFYVELCKDIEEYIRQLNNFYEE